MKKYLLVIFFLLYSLVQAQAVCSGGTLPFQLQNNTIADASQVMANYNAIISSVNATCAASGSNSDITSLNNLTTPLSTSFGGTWVWIGGTSTGSANAQVVATTTPAIGFSLLQGKCIRFIAGFTNNGATTLNVFGTGVTNFFKKTPTGPQAMIGGEIVVNNQVFACYDGTQYELDSIPIAVPIVFPAVPGGLFDCILSGGGSQILTLGTNKCVSTSDDQTTTMTINSQYTKTFANWVVGSGNGALDTGSIATNTWYHVFEIERTDTGVSDFLISLSATAPTFPASYTKKRRIGSIKTDATPNIISFFQNGDEFYWSTFPALDINAVTPSITAALVTVQTPLGVRTKAFFNATISFGALVGTGILFSSPDVADAAPSFTASPLASISYNEQSASTQLASQISVWTNASSQVRWRAVNANGVFYLQTIGWLDYRGKQN